jgi:hypothetical protein
MRAAELRARAEEQCAACEARLEALGTVFGKEKAALEALLNERNLRLEWNSQVEAAREALLDERNLLLEEYRQEKAELKQEKADLKQEKADLKRENAKLKALLQEQHIVDGQP